MVWLFPAIAVDGGLSLTTIIVSETAGQEFPETLSTKELLPTNRFETLVGETKGSGMIPVPEITVQKAKVGKVMALSSPLATQTT